MNDRLERELGYRFKDPSLLALALTHESFVNEDQGDSKSNERLEFLGDSVLGLVVAEELFRRHPLPEGHLATMKAHLVSTVVLAKKASSIELDSFMLLGRGEALSNQRKRRSLLADAFEAVLGAVYLDGGLEAGRDLVLRFFEDELARGDGRRRDQKSRLQEVTQRHFKELPEYRTAAQSGPSHQPEFEVEVWFREVCLGRGRGQSKRDAGQLAAGEALEKIEQHDAVWQALLAERQDP